MIRYYYYYQSAKMSLYLAGQGRAHGQSSVDTDLRPHLKKILTAPHVNKRAVPVVLWRNYML